MKRLVWRFGNWATCVAFTFLYAAGARADDKIQFNRDIRPLLADNCFACHGPDARKVKGGLRLDLRENAVQPAKSGGVAIVPGRPEESELVRRITTADEDDLMPPADSHKTLTAAQKELLKRWIAEGAEYQQHWAYIPPVKAAVPAGLNGVDHLVGRRLKTLGWKPAPEADRRTLARRLHFDLTGLPPRPQEVTAFEADPSPGAYARYVERLLASPHFGERMAVGWLDVVRFADTIGYHSDNPRNIWPYRDYVIRAFNDNKPFDDFTREQLAGDLLPNPTREQRVASAFNRLLLTTEEGGAQPRDYEARYLTDRVRAVGAVWLGQTTGCAQCHDHKFDPISTRDFYSLGAFFADIQESIIGRREDGMLVPASSQEETLANLNRRVQAREREFAGAHFELTPVFERWLAEAEATLPQPKELAGLLAVPAGQRDAVHRAKLFTYFKNLTPELAGLRRELAAARKARADFEATIPRCLVTERNDRPRTVRILPRGNWMIETGEEVAPALPAVLAGDFAQDTGARLTRLDLANWLVDRNNPLTARVVMNRLWKQFFGTGLSKVLDDLGAQGEPPPNQPLLDWLACEFMDSGWDMKHMVRLIVNSATYRQSSTVSREQFARDPDNRELARQSRWRIEAELVRDQALAVAGLLVPTIGGPSAKPYQPAGYWENLNFPPREYEASRGSDQYRRGLYTWWQRSFTHPSMLAFDAPSREECTAERGRSNIPQQALVLLNDPSYVEAARTFAARILKESAGSMEQRLVWAWREMLCRPPTAGELATIQSVLSKHLAEYRASPADVAALLKVGQQPPPADVDTAELAAWTSVARILLNLHETITRS